MNRISEDAWAKVRTMPRTVGLELRRRVAWSVIRALFAWHGIDRRRGLCIFGRAHHAAAPR